MVPLLQNQYRVPHVAVQEFDPKFGARLRPPLAVPIGHLMDLLALVKETLYSLGSGVIGDFFH